MSADTTHEPNIDSAPRISIAMATYNGGKYIAEQLASIAGQEKLPFELVICDDGSSDDTLEIAGRFRDTAPFPVRIIRNDVNLGYTDNFLKAAKLCKGEWISFCDQDDFWFPNKLRNAAQAIQNNKGAVLILQPSIISDSDLKLRGRIFPSSPKPGVYGAARQYAFWGWPGFLDTVLADIIHDVKSTDRPINNAPGDLYSHDRWACMIANAIGGIVVLDEPVALYRRHPAALTGSHHRENAQERVSAALRTTSHHYEFRAIAALSATRHLREAAAGCRNSAWRQSIAIAADDFEKIAAIQNLRAELYSEDTLFSRLRCFIKIFTSRGYWGPPMIAMGGKSAVKDLAAVLGLIGSGSKDAPQDPA